jgi:hypothetical protein
MSPNGCCKSSIRWPTIRVRVAERACACVCVGVFVFVWRSG